MHAIFMILYF